MDYRYTAIVLKKREMGETDRIYTFYTEEQGKIQAIGKGVRKPEAKLASALETLSSADIMVVRTRGIGKVAGAVLERSFSHLRSDYGTLTQVLEAVSMLERMVDLEEEDRELFSLLLTFLETGEKVMKEKKVEKIPLLVEAFYYKMLSHLGYELELARCTVTGEKLVAGEQFILSPSAGGVVTQTGTAEVRDGLAVSENVIKLLRLFYTQSIEKMEKISISPDDLRQLIRFRRLFLQWIKH